MGIKEKLSSVKPAKANIVPLTKEALAKIKNPDIQSIYKKAGHKSEFFTTSGVDCGLSGMSKGEVLAQGIMPYIPKLFSRTIGNEQLRDFPRELMEEFVSDFTEGYKDKTPVVIINHKNNIGEVSSSTIVVGDTTLLIYQKLAKHKEFESNGRTRESLNAISMPTSAFVQADPVQIAKILKSSIATSNQNQGTVCQSASLMVEAVDGEQISPMAVLTNSLKYDINKNGEVFLTQDGMECNIGEDGKAIPGTQTKIEGPTVGIPEENIRVNNGKDAIATGCSVQIAANGDKYLAGSDDMFVLALDNMKDQATFIKPVQTASVDPVTPQA